LIENHYASLTHLHDPTPTATNYQEKQGT